MTFCPDCNTMGEVWSPEQGEMILCETCNGYGVIKEGEPDENDDTD
jgi:hypothetical protein